MYSETDFKILMFVYQVVKLIPDEWSIGLISQFLSGSVRLSLHKSRTSKILSGLARGENLKVGLVICFSKLCSPFLKLPFLFDRNSGYNMFSLSPYEFLPANISSFSFHQSECCTKTRQIWLNIAKFQFAPKNKDTC